jgi:serine/threonine-protein kinase
VTDEKIRNGKVAVECATKACELTGYKEFKALDVLAAAHAEAGNFGEALKWANKGLELAPEARKKHFRDAIELYKANTPFRMNDER